MLLQFLEPTFQLALVCLQRLDLLLVLPRVDHWSWRLGGLIFEFVDLFLKRVAQLLLLLIQLRCLVQLGKCGVVLVLEVCKLCL